MFRRPDPAGPIPARRDRAVSRYLRTEVAAYSPYWRTALAGSPDGVAPKPVAHYADVAPAAVLRPDVASIYHFGARRLAARTMWSRLWGRQGRLNDKRLVPRYKPVLWVMAEGVPIGYSQADVDRLGRLGVRWLHDAGVVAEEVVVSVLPPGPDLTWWFTATACRASGLSAFHAGPNPAAADVAGLRPSVLVGRPMDLLRLSDESRTDEHRADDNGLSPRLVLAVGAPLDDGLRARLGAGFGRAPVLHAWAPPGVRAPWVECAGGASTGLHTWPASEVVELVDPLSGVAAPPGAGGEVVWSPLGWRGTVLLRVRTGVFATVEDGPCPACGRVAPRLFVTTETPAFFAVLDRHPLVTGWQAELRTVDGMEELIVFLSPAPNANLDALLRELDSHLSATQYVVLRRSDLDARLAAHRDSRVVDLRSQPYP